MAESLDVHDGGPRVSRACGPCPLCGHPDSRPSWLGATYYSEQRFDYLECFSCASLHCCPMPDARMLAHLYGTSYGSGGETEFATEHPRVGWRIERLLERIPRGTFVDYGCGQGDVLSEAKKLGWRAVGFELDAKVALATEERTGAEVVTNLDELYDRSPADVLHLGDVIEHLTDLDRQMPGILRALRPGGLLVAQGPLEANANLFTLTLRAMRTLRRSPLARFPPYHVLLATADGQRRFFGRFGLEELEFKVHEVAWPAPSRLSLAHIWRPRSVAMFVIRRASQVASFLSWSSWGNRYFYIGRKPF